MRFRTLITMIIAGVILPLLSFGQGQYFNVLQDYDSTVDFGTNILQLSDTGFLIYGTGFNNNINTEQLEWMTVNGDASQVLNKHSLGSAIYGTDYFSGHPGSLKHLSGGGYVAPITKGTFNTSHTYRQTTGLIWLNNQLDTTLVRTYTDTSIYSDIANDCTLLPDGGYLITGRSDLNTDTAEAQIYALLIRTDSSGNLLWSKRYKQNPTYGAGFQTAVYSGNGEITVGGFTEGVDMANGIYIAFPWFVVIDTTGNVLFQREYFHYRGGGSIRKDVNGGFFHWGSVDSLTVPNDPLDFRNFPGYIAHLDDNLLFQWTKVFYDTIHPDYNIQVQNVQQLHDSCYLVMGSYRSIVTPGLQSWVAKISKTGTILWQQVLMVDTGRDESYLEDAVEKPDHNIVLTGMGFLRDPNNPQFRDQDFWIVGLDSNGCPQPGCAPTGVHNITAAALQDIIVYPNPSNGTFTIRASSQKGKWIQVMNALGQVVYNEQASFIQGEIPVHLNVPAGMYIMQLIDADGGKVIKPLIIYK
jgi:Secretion system C-terminal sorting domain